MHYNTQVFAHLMIKYTLKILLLLFFSPADYYVV